MAGFFRSEATLGVWGISSPNELDWNRKTAAAAAAVL